MFVSSVNKLERQSQQLFLLAHAACSLLPMVLFSCHTNVLCWYIECYTSIARQIYVSGRMYGLCEESDHPDSRHNNPLLQISFLFFSCEMQLSLFYLWIMAISMAGYLVFIFSWRRTSLTNWDCGVRVGHQLQWPVPLHICSHCIPPSVGICTPVCSRPNLRSNARQWIGLESVHCALMLIAINIYGNTVVSSLHFFGPSLFNSVLLY